MNKNEKILCWCKTCREEIELHEDQLDKCPLCDSRNIHVFSEEELQHEARIDKHIDEQYKYIY